MRHRHSVTEDPIKVVGIATIAAAVGAAVAMLFTPRSGTQVRSGLKRRASHMKEEVQEHFDLTGDQAKESVDEAKQRLQSTAAKVAEDAKATAAKVKPDAKATTPRAKSVTKTTPSSRSTRPKAQ